MKRLAMLVAAVAVLVGLTACEPKMTITAGSDTSNVDCLEVIHIVGKVAPASATPRVTLQQTVKGKWTDVTGWGTTDTTKPATVRRAGVSKSTGGYSIPLMLIYISNRAHLRTRSEGGTASPSFYLKADVQNDC